jgi:hypothetical protein
MIPIINPVIAADARGASHQNQPVWKGQRAQRCQGDQAGGNTKTDISPDHKDIAVGKVKEHQNAVDHGIPQGDQGIEAAPLQGVHQILKEKGHRVRSFYH